MVSTLTKYPPGSLREFSALSLPLILIFVSGGLMELCDRAFLSRLSMNFLHGSLNAAYLCRIFQTPMMRITSMGQIFIAFYKGEDSLKNIGSCVWQLIWFSLISMIVIIPCGFTVGFFFFKETSITDAGGLYFYPLLLTNFLFPIGGALSAFHIGQGRSKIVVLVSLVSYLINILLDYFLILGVNGLIPSLGTLGAALAKIGSQTTFCSILFYHFLKKKNRILYGTNDCSFRPKLLIYYLRTSLPRVLAAIIITATWAATTHIMVVKTEMHLIALSIGGSIILSLAFLYEGMGQGDSFSAKDISCCCVYEFCTCLSWDEPLELVSQ
ncbi:MAG: hypothetical protein HYZ47_00495, partial [Simkania negevensis]|nr:hypothetical protein [Simkania negevensis]